MDQQVIIRRTRINQPSNLQPFHHLHGESVIVEDTGEKIVAVYFTDGPISSLLIPRNALTLPIIPIPKYSLASRF